MRIKELFLSVIFGLFLVTIMAGCDHGHSHDDEHSHEPANKENEKTYTKDSTIHKTID